MPLDYKIDKEMLRLIAEANVKYGEYKSLLNTLEFDAGFFLDSIILNESYKSTQIEGTQISQDEMYYLKYMKKTDDNQEIQNLKKTIEYAGAYLKSGKQICYELVNEMHKIILDSVRGSQKTPGKIRTTQNWIGPRGCTMQNATFIPPIPEEVYGLLMNLYEYMNDEFIDPLLVNVALSHMQFETIHAYKDGNGRLGRALIPVQMSMLDHSTPILYMSEILELYKPSYQRHLMECRRGNAADENDICLGYAFCQLREQPFSNNMIPFTSLFIDDLCVDAKTRGQHVGESLFEYVKSEAERLGCYEVTLNVWSGNTSAEKFYEKMGLKTKERQMEYIL